MNWHYKYCLGYLFPCSQGIYSNTAVFKFYPRGVRLSIGLFSIMSWDASCRKIPTSIYYLCSSFSTLFKLYARGTCYTFYGDASRMEFRVMLKDS